MRVGRNASVRRVVATIAACGLAIGACGGDDDDANPATTEATTEESAPAATAEESPATEAPTSETSGGSEAPATGGDAAARVEAFRQPVTELPLSSPIAVEAGKKLFYVQCSVPVCAEIAVGI